MTYAKRLLMPAVAILTLALTAPMITPATATAASPKAEKNTLVAKQSDKKSSVARATKGTAEKKRTSSSKSRKKASKPNKAKSVEQTRSTDSRDVWLQRSRESELMTGMASWYGNKFHGNATASGLNYDMYTFTAAHRTLPIGTVVRVTDQANGKSVMVCITDRGPFIRGRIIDLSYAAAHQLDLGTRGVGKVGLEVVSDERGMPLSDDQAYFVRYDAEKGDEKVGPFRAFSDASAMHEALRQAHPEAEVVLGTSR